MTQSSRSRAVVFIVCLIVAIAIGGLAVYLLKSETKPDAAVVESYKLMAVPPDPESPFPKELTADFMLSGRHWVAKGPVTDVEAKRLALKESSMEGLEILNGEISASGLALFKGKHLKHLELDETEVSPEFGPVISSFTELKFLCLSDRSVTDALMAKITGPATVEAINLRKAHISSAGVTSLVRAFPALQDLNLDGVRQADDGAVGDILKLRDLSEINVSGTSLSEAGVVKIAKGLPLKRLAIGGLPISDYCLQSIKTERLTSIDLHKTDVTDQTLKLLSGAKELKSLTIYNCPRISSRGLAFFRAKQPHCALILNGAKADSDLIKP